MSSDNLAHHIASSRNRHFSPWNVFSALLLLPDQPLISMARRVMESFGISVFAAGSVLEAERILRNTRLDLAICDFDMPCAADFSLLQPSSRWRGVSIGLMPTARLDHASHKRIQIRIQKPVSVDMLVRSLKASYTNMAQQRIAAYRHTMPVKLVSGTLAHRGWQRTLQQVSVLNVSQTALHATVYVVWSHTSGRAGIVFDRSVGPEMRKLQDRLNTWLPRELGVMARTA